MESNIKKNQFRQESTLKVVYLWGFSKLNYLIFTIGLVLIFFGYVVMATGEVNSFQSLILAPILLFTGYIILIPLSLIIQDKEN